MANMKIAKNIISLLVGLIMMGLIMSAPAGAEASNTGSAQGIQISPTLVELNVAKGDVRLIKLTITNVTAADLVYTASVDDFNAADETGSPHILLNSDLPTTASVKTWVSTVPEFTLKSHESKEIIAQVIVPSDAEAGGHYGVLRFSGAAPEIDSTGVGLSASAGVLLLVRVEGTVTEKATLSSFYSLLNDKQSSFFENSPINFVTRIKNEGNIHIKPFGNIEIKDMFGNIIKAIVVNSDKSNILPDSTRRFESEYSAKWMIGRYTANLTLGYGTTGQAITNTISFWVIPYKIIGAFLLILATIIFIFKRLITVYNRHIIEKAKNETTNKDKKRKKT